MIRYFIARVYVAPEEFEEGVLRLVCRCGRELAAARPCPVRRVVRCECGEESSVTAEWSE